MASAEEIISSANNRADRILDAAMRVANDLIRGDTSFTSMSWGYADAPDPPEIDDLEPFDVAQPTAPVLDPIVNNVSLTDIPDPPNDVSEPQPPGLTGFSTMPTLTGFPADNLPSEIAVSDIGEYPSKNINRPEINIGSAPEMNIDDAATFIGDIPAIGTSTMPDAPDIDYPELPSANDIGLPDKPSLNFPDFNANKPVESFDERDVKRIEDYYSFSTPTGSLWNSTNLGYIQNKLRSDVLTGGTGIEASVQDAIYNKAAERDLLAVNDALRLAAQQIGKKGFPIAPGRLAAQQNEILDKYLMTKAETSRSVMTNTAELAQKNIQFAINGLTQLEQLQVQFAISFADRMLNVAKFSVDAAIALINISIAKFNARIEAYKAEVSSFELKIRAEAQKIEIFKSQIEASRIKNEINMQQIEIYKAKFAALQYATDIYRSQISAYNAQIDAEKTKIETYKARADVYQSMVQAEIAKFQGFEAKVRGETAKVDIYKADIDAYASDIKAYSVKADTKLKEVDAKIAAARTATDVYIAKVNAVKSMNEQTLNTHETSLNVTRSQNEHQLQIYSNRIAAYRAKIDHSANLYGNKITAIRAANDNAIGLQTNYLNAIRATNEQKISAFSNELNVYKSNIDLGVAKGNLQIAYTNVYNERYKADIERYRATTMLQSENVKIIINKMQNDLQIRSTALSGAANAYASMASGAMSAVNGVAQTITQA